MRVFFGKIIRNMFSKKFWGLRPGSALGRWKLYYWCSEKLCNISRKTPVLEFLFNKIVGLKFCESLVVINFKEISFLTIINFKNANWPLDPVGGAYSPPPAFPPELFLSRFAPFARASSLGSEGLPRFLLISVLMPVKKRLRCFPVNT